MSGDKQVPQTNNINSVDELTFRGYFWLSVKGWPDLFWLGYLTGLAYIILTLEKGHDFMPPDNSSLDSLLGYKHSDIQPQCNLEWRCHVIKHLITQFIPMNWTTMCMLDYSMHFVSLETFRLQHKWFVCLCWDNVPVNNFPVMEGRSHRFPGIMVLSGSKVSCSRTQHGGVMFRAPDFWLRCPTLYHWATSHPIAQMNITTTKIN